MFLLLLFSNYIDGLCINDKHWRDSEPNNIDDKNCAFSVTEDNDYLTGNLGFVVVIAIQLFHFFVIHQIGMHQIIIQHPQSHQL